MQFIDDHERWWREHGQFIVPADTATGELLDKLKCYSANLSLAVDASEINDLQCRVEELELQVKDAEDENQGLRNKVSELKDKNEKLIAKTRELKEEALNLEDELRRLENKLNNLE